MPQLCSGKVCRKSCNAVGVVSGSIAELGDCDTQPSNLEPHLGGISTQLSTGSCSSNS
jgi:hypothetical protein